MTNKATIDLVVKSVDEDARLLEGWATKPEEDRMGDIVLPRGAVYELPLPFLLDHDHAKQVGHVEKVEVTDKGIRFWARIQKIAEEGEAKRLTDYAWTLVKSKLRSAVSIGFRALDSEQIPNSYGIKFKSWEWLELSAVSVPALAGAKITNIKSFKDGDTFITATPEMVDATVKLISAREQHIKSGAVAITR